LLTQAIPEYLRDELPMIIKRYTNRHFTLHTSRSCSLGHCAQLSYTIQHGTVLAIFPHPPDNHHCSDVVYWRRRRIQQQVSNHTFNESYWDEGSHLTWHKIRSYQRGSSQLITQHIIEETKPNTTRANVSQ